MSGDERRGGAFYDNPRVLDDYLAHRHRSVRSPNLTMEEPAFLRAAGDLGGTRILDLGCGDGSFARRAVELGCRRYVGVDGSALMVDRARHDLSDLIGGAPGSGPEAGADVSIVRADLEDIEREAATSIGGPFDLVACRMAMHYLADPLPLLGTVRELLTPDGRFVASIVHPVITAARVPHGGESTGPRTTWTVDDYFDPGPRHRDWFGSTVTWYHRTIEDHIGALAAAGLRLVTLSEAAPDPAAFDGDRAEYERRVRVPLFLVLAAAAP